MREVEKKVHDLVWQLTAVSERQRQLLAEAQADAGADSQLVEGVSAGGEVVERLAERLAQVEALLPSLNALSMLDKQPSPQQAFILAAHNSYEHPGLAKLAARSEQARAAFMSLLGCPSGKGSGSSVRRACVAAAEAAAAAKGAAAAPVVRPPAALAVAVPPAARRASRKPSAKKRAARAVQLPPDLAPAAVKLSAAAKAAKAAIAAKAQPSPAAVQPKQPPRKEADGRQWQQQGRRQEEEEQGGAAADAAVLEGAGAAWACLLACLKTCVTQRACGVCRETTSACKFHRRLL